MIHQLLLVVQVIVALAMVSLVLLQHGKGADIGAVFGSGASGTFFGSSGAGGFLYKSTWVLAAIFCASSLGLTYIEAHQATKIKVLPGAPMQQQQPTKVIQLPTDQPAEDGQASQNKADEAK